MVYSATQFAKKLDISRSYLYYLKDNIEINLETSHNGKIIWNDKNFQQILDYIQSLIDLTNQMINMYFMYIKVI